MAGPLVHDEEHQSSATAVDNALKKLDSLFCKYIMQLFKIHTAGVVKGQTGDAIRAYAFQAASVRTAISAIAECHSQASQCFLSDVDATDQDIF